MCYSCKQWQKQQRQTSIPRPRVPHFLLESKLKTEYSFWLFLSYKSLNSQSQGKNIIWKSFFFCLDAQLSKMVRRTRGCWWVFSWHLSGFVFGVWKRKRGGDGYIHLCSRWCSRANPPPCKPVSLSYHVFLLIIHPSVDNRTQPF